MTAPAPRPHRRWDHLPSSTAYQRANRWLAIRITAAVGSMTCAYVFAAIALVSLPAAISSRSVIVIVSWVAQTLLQLVLLAVILVGQNVAGEASDARATRTLADADEIKDLVTVSADRLDCDTKGGLGDVMAAVAAGRADLALVVAALNGRPGAG